MRLNRREFVASAGWSLLAGVATGCGGLLRNDAATSPSAAVASSFTGDWDWVRGQFDLSPDYLHFSQFFIVSHPKPVRDAIELYRRRIDANPFLVIERGMFESDEENMALRARTAAADYLGAKPDEIALVDSTTQGLALLYHGLRLRPGQEILTTTHDHFVHHESIRLAAEKLGASWRRVSLYDASHLVSVGEVTGNLRRAIQPQTRVVGLTWVHSSTGVKLPIRALADVISDVNRKRSEKDRIVLIVDGVHGFGSQDESPVDMGCDFFAAGTHKWIMAPRGTGIIWAREESWARLRPTIPSFSGREVIDAWLHQKEPGPTRASHVSPGGFKAYEHQWAMAEAFRFHQQIGRARIAARIATLNDRCKAGLATMPKVTLHTPRDARYSAGIICFEVAGMTTGAVVAKLLEQKVIASSSPYRVSLARLAPSLVNDEDEVDRALAAVRALA